MSDIDESVLKSLARRRDAFKLCLMLAEIIDAGDYYPESIAMALASLFTVQADELEEDPVDLFEHITEVREDGLGFALTEAEATGIVGNYSLAIAQFYQQ